MRERVSAVRPHAAAYVDIGIAHLIICGSVADHEQKHILGGSIDEPMGIVRAGSKTSTHTGPQHFHTGIGFQFDLPLQDVDELVLPRVRMAM